MHEAQSETSPAPPRRRGLTFWLWIVFGAVLALLVSPFVVGAFLPDVYEGSVRAELALAPEEVWRAVADPERFPLSAGLAREVRPLPDREGGRAWIEEQRNTTLTVTTLESDPPRRAVRRVEDPGSPLSCTWEIDVEPAGAGSLVRVLQRCEVSGGRLGAPHLRFIMRFLDAATMGPRSYLERLGEGLGAPVVLE